MMKLAVKVVNAYNLLPKAGNGSVNPYVEVELDGQRQRTSTKFNDLNPTWNETLVFNLPSHGDPLDHTVDVSVYHDPSSFSATVSSSTPRRSSPSSPHVVSIRRNFLGRVRLSTSVVDGSLLEATLRVFELEKRSMFSRVTGKIGFKLYFLPEPNAGAAYDAKIHVTATASTERHAPASTIPEPSVFSDIATAANGVLPPETSPSPLKKKKKSRTYQPSPNYMSTRTTPWNNSYYPANQTPMTVSAPPAPSPLPFGLLETRPLIAARAALNWTDFILNMLGLGGGGRGTHYDLVEMDEYLYVNIIKARDLPRMDITGSLDPYVEVRVGNFAGSTGYVVKNQNPEWSEVFAFAKENLQSDILEVVVKDKDFLRDDYVGKAVVNIAEVPSRELPDSPVAPQWYQIIKNDGSAAPAVLGELMMAVWMGNQADDAYPDALHSDGHSLLDRAAHVQTRSKVYLNPGLCYLWVHIFSVQDLDRSDRNRVNSSVYVMVQLGQQIFQTKPLPLGSNNPVRIEKCVLVANETSDEPLTITVMVRTGSNRVEALGQVVLGKGQIQTWSDYRRIKPPEWFDLSEPNRNGKPAVPISADGNGRDEGDHQHSSKIQLSVYYDNGYHVFDEAAHFSSDFRPSAAHLRTPKIGVLKLGILDAQNLLPGKSRNGVSSVDAYCVAKYGPKWVRTRTILGTPAPRWSEQYSWDVFDPHTVVTIVVVDNCRIDGAVNGDRDRILGKVRVRLSTLELGRVYTHYYPLLLVRPSGPVRSGDLHLAIQFTATSFSSVLVSYTKPKEPVQHHVCPLPSRQTDHLRHHVMLAILSKLARAEPPLPREVVEYILEPPPPSYELAIIESFSRRKWGAHEQRLAIISSVAENLYIWLIEVQNWKRPTVNVLLHKLLLAFTLSPRLILPTLLLYLFIAGVANYLDRPRHPPHFDTYLSHLERVTPEELDEQSSTLPDEAVAMRYDGLRHKILNYQLIAEHLAIHAERIAGILSWRDPRATPIFMGFSLLAAIALYVTPVKIIVLLVSLYNLRHPVFRRGTPPLLLNFFKRLPSKADIML